MAQSSLIPVGQPGFTQYTGALLRDPGKAPGDEGRFVFAIQPHHLNGGGAVHGGLIMTVCDNVLGFTVHEALAGQSATTVTLNVDFLSAGLPDAPLHGTASITRKTRSLVFVEGMLTQNGKPVAAASGIWKIIGA